MTGVGALADHVLLDVANRRNLGVDIAEAVVSIGRDGSMEAAPALQIIVNDPDDSLMQASVLVRPAQRLTGFPEGFTPRPIDLSMGGVFYRLRSLQRDEGSDLVTMVFEHRGVSYMREHDWAISASRADVTRAQFIRRQVVEVGKRRSAPHRLAFWAPQLRKAMPIAATPEEGLSPRAEADRSASAVADMAGNAKGLTANTHPMDADMRRNAVLLLRRAALDGAGPKATLALIECALHESGMRNLNRGDSSSVGLLQLLDIHFGGSRSTNGGRRDVDKVAHHFLADPGYTGAGGAISLARSHPDWSAGRIAYVVNAGPLSAASPAQFDAFRGEAVKIIEALSGGDLGDLASAASAGDSGGGGGSYTAQYRYKRPAGEDAWTNTGNLADEVGKHRFVTEPWPGAEVFVYASGEQLLTLPSQTRVSPEEGIALIGRPGYTLDWGRSVRTLSLSVAADEARELAWGLPVDVADVGAADGKWLVWSLHEDDGSDVVTLELRQPQPTKPEPASERVQRADPNDWQSTGGVGGALGAGSVKGMTPRDVIEQLVLPIGRSHDLRSANGGTLTAANVTAANGAHGPTGSGNTSDHQGPGDVRWAVDMSNGTYYPNAPKPQACADELARTFGIPWSGQGMRSHGIGGGLEVQLIWGIDLGADGDHRNHVHFGCHTA